MSKDREISSSDSPAAERLAPMQRLFLGVLVIQPSPFCNINCDYCYLPDRASTKRMSFDVLEQIMRRIDESGLAVHPFEILWHAGEPLAVPIDWYEKAFEIIGSFPNLQGKITHSFQTNGTLVNEAWCEFFEKHRVELGVSIDGPESIHDAHRVTRKGEGTHAKTMVGVAKLQEHGVPFGVVAVISEASLDHPDEIYDYFANLGIQGVGFNIEEVEGVNETSSLGKGEADERVQKFLERVFELNRDAGFQLKIREFELARQKIFDPHLSNGNSYFNLETNPLAMVNVDCDGNFSTFSPELLGQSTPKYGTFTFGNLTANSVFDGTQSPAFQEIYGDIREGNEACEKSCEFFRYCGGASPSNKYYENGTFNSAETMHCRHMIQAPMRIVLEDIEKDFGLA